MVLKNNVYGGVMRVDRRDFIKYCVSSAAALSLPITVVGKLEQALAAESSALPTVVWLNGANCTGCTVSLANLFDESGPTDVADLLLNTINLAYHPTLMGAAGDLAVQQLAEAAQNDFILVVDGGIPTAFNGHTCLLWTENGTEVTAMEAVQRLAPSAQAVLSIGTCASFGGIPSGTPNPTDIVSVSQLTGIPSVNIPGCPTHPDWIVWTIAHLLTGEMPTLDYYNRPLQLYGRELHKDCPYREREETKTFGVRNACLEELGCKGENTRSDCPSRKWNNSTNWCIGAGNICIGCTESGFPDRFSPFYKLEYSYAPYEKADPEPNPQPDPEPEPQPDPSPDPTATRLSISEAAWTDDRAELKAKGFGDKGFIVTLYNDDTGQQIGAVSVSREGKWRFRSRGVTPAPHRLKAVSGGRVAYISVKVEY